MGDTTTAVTRLPRWFLAVVSGVLLGFSQPVVIEALGDEPLDRTGLTGALAIIGLVPVLLALRGTTPSSAWKLGFVASFVQFTINIQWIVVALVVFGRIPLALSWVILALLTSTLAAMVATAYALTRLFVGRFGWAQWTVFPAVLTAVELCRNAGPFGGFPWGNIGTSFATVPLLLQPAALFGVHGLVFCAALASSCGAELVAAWRGGRPVPRRPLVVVAAVLVLWVGYGAARMAQAPSGGPSGGTSGGTPGGTPGGPTGAASVRVALLQGNIEQGIRNHTEWTGRTVLDRYRALQNEAVSRGAQLVVWPEASFPLRLRRDVEDLREDLFVEDGLEPPAAVVGAVGFERVLEGNVMLERRSNSAFVVGAGQRVVGRADKSHLVPFGEYVPWPFDALIEQIVPIGGTRPGAGYEAIDVEVALSDGTRRALPVGVTICYEGIFPEIARALRNAGAELHVNVTNDGWYGISSAPTQHLAFYAIRAVESGMPVVRAANTGKSGWADTRGRLHDVTSIYTHAAVIADVPLVLERTVYASLGEWVALPCALFAGGAWIVALWGPGVLRRPRARADALIGLVGLVAAAAGVAFHVVQPGLIRDEGTVTRTVLLVVAGLLVGVGAWSGRPWGRKAQVGVGLVGVVVGVAAPLLGAPVVSLVLAGAGGSLALFQRRRAAHYQRPGDPLVLDDESGTSTS